MTFKTIITIASLCFATESFAQGFTPAYVERADSADHYIKAERWADAERNLKTALRLEPANPGNALLLSNLGYVQTMLGKFDDALESYDVSLSIAPKSAVVALKPGLTYASAGKTAEAMKDLDAALAIDSTRTMPLKMRGLLRLGNGDIAGRRHDLTLLASYDKRTQPHTTALRSAKS